MLKKIIDLHSPSYGPRTFYDFKDLSDATGIDILKRSVKQLLGDGYKFDMVMKNVFKKEIKLDTVSKVFVEYVISGGAKHVFKLHLQFTDQHTLTLLLAVKESKNKDYIEDTELKNFNDLQWSDLVPKFGALLYNKNHLKCYIEEWIEGTSVDKLGRKLTDSEVHEIAKAWLRIVKYLSEKSDIESCPGDQNAGNIILTKDNSYKVVDLGNSRKYVTTHSLILGNLIKYYVRASENTLFKATSESGSILPVLEAVKAVFGDMSLSWFFSAYLRNNDISPICRNELKKYILQNFHYRSEAEFADDLKEYFLKNLVKDIENAREGAQIYNSTSLFDHHVRKLTDLPELINEAKFFRKARKTAFDSNSQQKPKDKKHKRTKFDWRQEGD